ncbi:MAG: hypothetical protein IJB96_09895, partial [Lachnospira sp.]|nr:hypothetical protein [Lachnospira sp.]
MAVMTLLIAGIRRKKGTFICVVLLTAIVVSMIASMNSVKDNYYKGMDNALTKLEAGEVQCFIRSESLTDEIRQKLEGSKLVSDVKYISAISAGKATVGEETTNNSHFLMRMREGISLFNDELNGLTEDTPVLTSGEIYLPYGLRQVLSCKVGDKITYSVIDKKYTFVVKGFVQEPTQGATNIGWKQVFISDEDFDKIYRETKPLETQDAFIDVTCVIIHQAEDSELSIAKFQRQLNLETKIVTTAFGTLNKYQSVHYTTLMTDVVMGIVQAFVICLFVVMLVVMGHSIGTEIEIDYVDLGVLKAQGFVREQIRLVMGLQYLLAESVGAILGVIFSVPLERAISALCIEITAIMPTSGFSVGKALMCVLILLAVSGLLIIVKTGKIAAISPVRAISGGRDVIYWSSRIRFPIAKKLLAASVAVRQFTSEKKRYIATLFIIAILTFCMITVNLTGNLLSSREAMEAMGLISVNVELGHKDGIVEGRFDEAEAIIEEYSDIIRKCDTYRCYASVNGENYMCESYSDPSVMTRTLKGREIRYDNEILITQIVADALEVGIGDEVTVAYGEDEAKFIVAGLYQS